MLPSHLLSDATPSAIDRLATIDTIRDACLHLGIRPYRGDCIYDGRAYLRAEVAAEHARCARIDRECARPVPHGC